MVLAPCLFSQQENKNPAEQKRIKKPDNQIFFTGTYLSIDSFDYRSYNFFSRIHLFKAFGLDFFSIAKADKIQAEDQTGGYFPKDLYNITFSLKAQNELFFMDAVVVSKSDKPFDSKDEIRPGFFAFYNILPTGSMGSGFYVGAIYFPFDSILPWNVPFPFFMYQYFSKDLTLMLGIPFFVRWNPLPFLSLNFFYLPVVDMKAFIDFYLSRTSRISLEGSWWSDNYTLAGRENRDEKLYFETQRIGLRFSQKIFFFLEWSLFAGRLISADYFKGESYSKGFGKKELNPSWVIEASMKTFF